MGLNFTYAMQAEARGHVEALLIGESLLLEASNFVQAVQNRQGMMIACPEEIAYQRGYITAEDVQQLARKMVDTDYRAYLYQLL